MKVKEILANHSGGFYTEASNIKDTVSIFGPKGVIIDSLEILDALCDLETQFNIQIHDEDLTEELFSSVNALVMYIDAKVKKNK